MAQAARLGICLLLASSGAQAAVYSTGYEYDVPNGIVTRTDPNGSVVEYHYDGIDRLSKVVLDAQGASSELNYYYDLTDQLERITYPGGEQLYGYDQFDRLETIADFGAGPLLQFQYDHQDRITWITYMGNNGSVCYEYDPDGRITRVGRVFSGSGTVCSAADEKFDYTYDSRGRLSAVKYPNGIVGFRQYDESGRLSVAGYRRANSALIYSDTFAYVPGSRLYASITRATPTESRKTDYIYDAWERLLTVTEADGRRTEYEYDPFGNRTRERVTNINDPEAEGGLPKPYGDYVYEYAEGGNRLVRLLKDGVELESYTYDNAGRMIERVHATKGTTTYGYDARGLLTQASRFGVEISYTYDALGARKTKTINGTTTRYLTAPVFGLSRVLVEFDTSMNIKRTYVYGGDQPLKDEPVAGNHNLDLYLLSDGIVGSITDVASPNGAVSNLFQYDAFGDRIVNFASTAYSYAGQEHDAGTGLIYLRARYYDPSLGRFISADPFWGRLDEPASQNRYTYAHNNPLLYVDPTGLVVWDDLLLNSAAFVVSTVQTVGGVVVTAVGGPLAPVGAIASGSGLYNMVNSGIGVYNALNETNHPGFAEIVGSSLGGDQGGKVGAAIDMYASVRGGVIGIKNLSGMGGSAADIVDIGISVNAFKNDTPAYRDDGVVQMCR